MIDTDPVPRPKRKTGPKPSGYGSKAVRIPDELLPVVEELKRLILQRRRPKRD